MVSLCSRRAHHDAKRYLQLTELLSFLWSRMEELRRAQEAVQHKLASAM